MFAKALPYLGFWFMVCLSTVALVFLFFGGLHLVNCFQRTRL